MTHAAPEGLFDDTEPGLNSKGPDFPKTAPAAALLGGSQAVSLRTQETGKFVHIKSAGWAIFADSSDTKYILVQYGTEHYIVIANGTWKGYYLSYNRNSYVGAYRSWDRASYWGVDPVDCTPYPGLYLYDANYVCCNGVQDAIDKLVTVVAY